MKQNITGQVPSRKASRSKDPFFPFFAADWLTDGRVRSMSRSLRASYLELLCHDWIDDGIPDDWESQRRLGGITQSEKGGWQRVVTQCFVPHLTKRGFVTNRKLERLRAERVAYRKEQQQKALASWGPNSCRGNAAASSRQMPMHMPEACSLSPSPLSSTSTEHAAPTLSSGTGTPVRTVPLASPQPTPERWCSSKKPVEERRETQILNDEMSAGFAKIAARAAGKGDA